MKKIAIGVIATSFAFTLCANAQISSVLNAASLSDQAVAPGSIVTIKGSRLTNVTASLTDGSNLPLTLGGVTLSIGSYQAALFYVSPTQVNARIDPRVAIGRASVLLTSPTGSFSSSVNVTASAPGLFSLNGSGVGDGAIIHALSYGISAFSPQTGGGPTFLSLFGTGMSLTPDKPVVRIGGVAVPVLFAGDVLPAGLQQINVQLPASLAGAGRVSVVVESLGVKSNAVEIVVLPTREQSPFPSYNENEDRSREISNLAWVPGTSLVLVTDENDDVLRVADVREKKILRTIVLPSGANPVAVAVNAAGTTAVVCERDRAKVALVNLQTNLVSSEFAVGNGPIAVAISGSNVLVANQQDNTVSIFSLQNLLQVTHVPVRKSPRGVAVDPAGARAYVANQGDASISVIDIGNRIVLETFSLGAGAQPQSIAVVQVNGQNLLLVTDPGAGPEGKVYLVNPTSKAVTPVNANPQRSGGSSDLAVNGTTAYIAFQTGTSVAYGTVTPTGLTTQPIQVGVGARAMAVDTLDKLLIVANQGTGNLTLIDLTTNQIVGRVDAVRRSDDDDDDHDDRLQGANVPVVGSLSPSSGKAGTTFTLTINGSRLNGATDVIFVDPDTIPGKGHGKGKGRDDFRDNGPFGSRDKDITVRQIAVNTAGTQMTVQVQIAASHKDGKRVVRVQTPNGESSFVAASGNTFNVTEK